MKLFERTGGHWLFWWSAVYFIVGIVNVFVLKVDWFPWVQFAWLSIIALPLTYNPLARWLNMKENNMFDWFKKPDYSNVVKFPEVKTPYIEPPAPVPPKPEAKIFYRIGTTDNNRVSFSMGHMEITMTKLGCQYMIDQLSVFMNQLPDEDEDEI